MTKTARILLTRAALATLGGRPFYRVPGPEGEGAPAGGGGGGAGDGEKDKGAKAGAGDKQGDKGGSAGEQPKKIELTQEELDAKIQAALDRQAKRAQRDREEADRKRQDDEAKQKGEFQKLYDAEVEKGKSREAALAAAELSMRRRDAVDRMRDFVDANHPDYRGVVSKYLAPLLKVDAKDTPDADLDKQIKSIVEEYVKDNPRTAARSLPGSPNRASELARQQRAAAGVGEKRKAIGQPGGPGGNGLGEGAAAGVVEYDGHDYIG